MTLARDWPSACASGLADLARRLDVGSSASSVDQTLRDLEVAFFRRGSEARDPALRGPAAGTVHQPESLLPRTGGKGWGGALMV